MKKSTDCTDHLNPVKQDTNNSYDVLKEEEFMESFDLTPELIKELNAKKRRWYHQGVVMLHRECVLRTRSYWQLIKDLTVMFVLGIVLTLCQGPQNALFIVWYCNMSDQIYVLYV